MTNNSTLKVSLIAVLSMAVLLPFAHAGTLLTQQRVAEIVAQQQQLRADVRGEKNGWDAVSKEQRGELLTRQQRLLDLLAGKDTLADLTETDQVEAANILEWIKALATNAEDERRVCRRERKTGSLRVTTVCQTVGDMNAQREKSRDGMRLGERMMQSPPKTGSQL